MIMDIWRRLQLLVTQAAGIRATKHKIQVDGLSEETLDNIDRIQAYGHSYRPKKGCQAYIVFPSGDRSHGFCIIVGDRRFTLDLEEGEVALHDDQGQKVHITRNGIVVDGGGKPLLFTNTPKARFECDIESTGEITDRVSAGGRSMSGMRDIYDGHTHQGDSGGTTSNPNQGM